MAATDATTDPVKGQPYRMPCRLVDNQGNLLTNWTGAAATAYPDNGAGSAATIAEAPVGSGVGYIDLSAAQMTSSMTMVKATCTNANAVAHVEAVYPRNLSQFSGRFDAQSPLRVEQLLIDLYSLLGGNGANQTGAALQMLNPDGSVHLAGVVGQNATSGTRSKMT